jgi:tripartite-type tricarboxylate transporter receptor subunit TctC
MRLTRIGSALAGLCLTLAPLFAAAQDYPSKPVRLIVPYAPGGVLDVSARSIAIPLAKELGQQVIVENKPGGGGNIGTDLVARSEPDGYTILMFTDTNTIAPALYRKLSYDPVADFAPVTLLASGSHVVVAHPSLPVASIKELIAYATTHPGKLSYASPGAGTAQHLGGEMLKSAAGGLHITHVPYKGGGQAINDVVGGQVQLAVLGLAPALPHIKAGKLKALGVTGEERVAVLPGVPTIQEAGLPGVQTTQWLGVAVAAGTPAPVQEKLYAAFVKSVNAPSVRSVLDRIGLRVTTSTSPAAFAAFIRSDIQRWPAIVKAAGATAD